MRFTQILPLALAGAVLASPVAVDKRSTTICGQWDTVVEDGYTLYQDLWNEATATSGSQCSTFSSYSGTTISWYTTWTWAGASTQVKSYANAVKTLSTISKLSAISTIESTWKWAYTGTSIVADVSYDMFTSSTSTGSNEYEIMIWLAALGGAGPISSTGSTIATPTIAGVSWKLYYGLNGSTKVYSFVAASEQTSFTGNIKLFYTYLNTAQGYPLTQYLLSIGAGTEPFTGTSATFTTSAYSVVVA